MEETLLKFLIYYENSLLLVQKLFFDEENLSTAYGENTFIISLIEAIAQEESENRSQNVYWGIKKKVIDGTSKIYTRKCYGYTNDENGELIIQPQEAESCN